MQKFKVEVEQEKDNWAIISLEPLAQGYGHTLGNSLRRTMLSSLQGAAITSIKISGVSHQFATIPGVIEDVIEIILNLKQLRMKVHSSEPVHLELKVKGERAITGADFKANSAVEIVNPELHIATLDGKTSELEMEIVVQTEIGRASCRERV